MSENRKKTVRVAIVCIVKIDYLVAFWTGIHVAHIYQVQLYHQQNCDAFSACFEDTQTKQKNRGVLCLFRGFLRKPARTKVSTTNIILHNSRQSWNLISGIHSSSRADHYSKSVLLKSDPIESKYNISGYSTIFFPYPLFHAVGKSTHTRVDFKIMPPSHFTCWGWLTIFCALQKK